MDSIPYAVSDFLELCSRTKDLKKEGAKWELLLWFVALASFCIYSGYQVSGVFFLIFFFFF
jgi:hypothetical protein